MTEVTGKINGREFYWKFRYPLGAFDKEGFLLFCPICGELYPMHHSGVDHKKQGGWHCKPMRRYFKRGNINEKYNFRKRLKQQMKDWQLEALRDMAKEIEG